MSYCTGIYATWDVAISLYFYIRQLPWHPEYPVYSGLTPAEGLARLAERTLPAYAAWVHSWHQNRDPDASLIVRYEQMLANPEEVMTPIAKHFALDSSPETICRIVQQHSFQRLSGGRSQGQQDARSFFRKGVAGDWRNHLSPELKRAYKAVIGQFLVEYGFEQDDAW
jgi:hypothetical protein